MMGMQMNGRINGSIIQTFRDLNMSKSVQQKDLAYLTQGRIEREARAPEVDQC